MTPENYVKGDHYYDPNRNRPYKSDKFPQLKRIEDYNKVLPVLELYRCVQSEGSRFGRPLLLLELQVVHIDVILEKKVVGVIAGIYQFILKKEHFHLMILLKYMMKIHI